MLLEVLAVLIEHKCLILRNILSDGLDVECSVRKGVIEKIFGEDKNRCRSKQDTNQYDLFWHLIITSWAEALRGNRLATDNRKEGMENLVMEQSEQGAQVCGGMLSGNNRVEQPAAASKNHTENLAGTSKDWSVQSAAGSKEQSAVEYAPVAGSKVHAAVEPKDHAAAEEHEAAGAVGEKHPMHRAHLRSNEDAPNNACIITLQQQVQSNSTVAAGNGGAKSAPSKVQSRNVDADGFTSVPYTRQHRTVNEMPQMECETSRNRLSLLGVYACMQTARSFGLLHQRSYSHPSSPLYVIILRRRNLHHILGFSRCNRVLYMLF